MLFVYKDENLGGERKQFVENDNWLGDKWNDQISSVYALKEGDWRLYTDVNYGGESELVCHGKKVYLVKKNDAYSSIKISENESECSKYLIQIHPFRLKRCSNHS